MIKVGIVVSLRDLWQGGANYFRNLLHCYNKHPDPEVKLAVFTTHPEDFDCYLSNSVEVHAWPEISKRSLVNIPRRVARHVLGYDPALVDLLKRNRIDLLSHSSAGRQRSVNTLYWQPDFQHKAMPQMFSAEDCANRDQYVAAVKVWGNILLSSHAAAADFRRYFPDLAAVRTHVLHFSSAGALDITPVSRGELSTLYPISEPYFFLPNQFWKHKNHAVVVEALLLTAPEIRVICTGSTEDWRDPSYFPSLMDRVKQAGLERRFVHLGTVPYPIVVSLMHHSLAVVQPSLFEGWSTTVEESKAMNKKIVLSKIDVHLEQAPERGVYFTPNSPDELAISLQRIYGGFDPAIESGFERQRASNRARLEQVWIHNYVLIVKEVVGRMGGHR